MPTTPITECLVPDCSNKVAIKSRGWCDKHYTRWKRHGDPLHVTKRNSRGLSLLERLELPGWIVTEQGCWEWRGKGPGERYGKMQVRGRTLLAHRVAYETWIGPIPEGQLIRHRCDNPPCINPEHLEPGTVADNSRDMVERGRGRDQRGERHNMALVTEAQVLAIREEYATGTVSQRTLGERYGLTQIAIGCIVRGKTWRHVGGPITRRGYGNPRY